MNIHDMIEDNPQALVTSYNGVLVADSLEVADRFGKRHADVIRSIEDIGRNLITQNCVLDGYFIEDSYPDNRNGRRRKKYLLTRDGFSLLVMGFTGPAALHWKLLYIEAFNKMEEKLRQSQPDITDMVSQITTQVIQTLLPEIKKAVTPPEPPQPPKPKYIYAVVSMDGVKKTTVHYNGYDPASVRSIAKTLEREKKKYVILQGEL